MPRTPISGTEQQLARLAGEDVTPREPQSAVEQWLSLIHAQGAALTPSGTVDITTNGTVDVTSYASAEVAVPEDHTNEDGIVDGSISGTYTNARVTSMVPYAFANRASMTGVSFPEVEASIPNYCFTACANLESVDFPKAKRIGERAFRNCTSLECASFPKVTNIYAYAFNNCSALEWLSFDDITAVPTLSDSNAFSGCDSLTALYFPDALVDQAKTETNWSTYASIIKPLSQKPSA